MENSMQVVVDKWQQRIDQLDTTTHNLANASAAGYKSFRLHFNGSLGTTVPSEPQGTAGPLVSTDFDRGPMQTTGNPLDAAIEGDGFFAVQTAYGVAYTRRGSFSLSKNGDLVTDTGENVLNKAGGKISVSGGKAEISGEGDILVDGRKVDTLKVVTFTDKTRLVRLPGCMFQDPGTAGPTEEKKPEIHAEHVEGSNVNAVSEMTQLINLQRMIEFYQKNMQAISELDKISNNRVGRLYS
ncbi:MAG: flagellar hook-basal body protein [Syntrophales bacterium]